MLRIVFGTFFEEIGAKVKNILKLSYLYQMQYVVQFDINQQSNPYAKFSPLNLLIHVGLTGCFYPIFRRCSTRMLSMNLQHTLRQLRKEEHNARVMALLKRNAIFYKRQRQALSSQWGQKILFEVEFLYSLPSRFLLGKIVGFENTLGTKMFACL